MSTRNLAQRRISERAAYSRNREQRLIYAKKWREANSDKVKAYRRAWKANVYPLQQRKMRELKSAPCMDCRGVFTPECMDFDHVPGRGEKLFHVTVEAMNRTTESIVEELAKCDLVCANCHRTRTWERNNAQ